MDNLENLGWNDEFAQKWAVQRLPGLVPARVIADFGTSQKIAVPAVRTAELSGKMAHYSNRQNIPKVGDWVGVKLLDNGHDVIEVILPRRSEFARKVAGKRTVKQVIAANVDVAFVLLAMDYDFSIERLKRYLYQLSADAIEPVIVLNKADATDAVNDYVARLHDIDVPVIVASALDGSGVADIIVRIRPGCTAILVGSSGVGKSTLTNRLLGREQQHTQTVRSADSAGRHTTVHRELFVLPNGGLLIDTPGIRELQLWGTQEDLDEDLSDVAHLASQCKYSTCRHGDEAGCAVRLALRKGTLSAGRYASYQKLKGELVTLKSRAIDRERAGNKRSYKNIKRQAEDGLREMKDEMDL